MSMELRVISYYCHQVEFADMVVPSAVHIYETFNPGSVVSVLGRNSSKNDWEVLWQTTQPQHLTQSRVFSPEIQVIRRVHIFV